MTNGRTFWDLIYELSIDGKIGWILFFALCILCIIIIKNVNIAREWNLKFADIIALYKPKKRKQAFQKRISLTIDSAQKKFNKEAPPCFRKLLPYDLKIEWVKETEDIETIIQENKIIVYVSNYKEETNQTIGVIHNYCSAGFAQKAKFYMDDAYKKATDIVVTKRFIQHTSTHMIDYFNREFAVLMLNSTILQTAYDKLCLIDNDGLFLPILLNEIDKYGSRLYPNDPNITNKTTILEFIIFIQCIANKKREERVDTLFSKNGINVRVILAVSDSVSNIKYPLDLIDTDIKNKRADTIYILASGSKIGYAKDIAEKACKGNPQQICNSNTSKYIRHSKNGQKKDSICYELNIIH